MSKQTNKNRRHRRHRTNVVCNEPGCNGTGKPRTTQESCTACNATGEYVIKKFRECHCKGKHKNCRKCHGTGKVIRFKGEVECRACAGKGFRYETVYDCKICGHLGATRFERDEEKRELAGAGVMGDLWPNEG